MDCRLLPGQTPADAEAIVRAALGEGDYEIEFLESVGGTRSDLDTTLWSALAEFTTGMEPGARLMPFACPGFTDSHFLREAYGTTAYGFFPISRHGHGAGDQAHPLRGRAHPGERPRAGDEHASVGRRLPPRLVSKSADALVVFGITGDLARTKTLPALDDLTLQGVLEMPGRRSRPAPAAHRRDARARAGRDQYGQGPEARPADARHVPLAALLRGRRRRGRQAPRAPAPGTEGGEAARPLPRDPSRELPGGLRGARRGRPAREREARRREAVRHRPRLRAGAATGG